MKKTFKEFYESKGFTKEAVDQKAKDDAGGLAELYGQYLEHLTAVLEEKTEKKASADDIKELKDEIAKERVAQMKQLNAVLNEYGIQIKKLSADEKKDSDLSFGDQVEKQLRAQMENLKALKEGTRSEVKAAAFKFEVKAPGAMTLAGNVSGGNIPVEDRLEGLNTLPLRRVRLMDVMSKRSTTSQLVSWVYQANRDGSVGPTAEGTAKNQIDFDLVVDSEKVKKVTAYIKVSTEMLDDIAWIRSEIEQELMRRLLNNVEQGVYNGDGTGENLNGIRTLAPAFSAAGFTGGVIDNPNSVDVLTVAINQIDIAQENDGVANYIFMHPTDVTKLLVTKVTATDKRYVDRLVQVGSNLVLDGVPIIKSTLCDVGEYLIGSFDLALIVTRSDVSFDIGLDEKDFVWNMRTILAEWRGLSAVKQNDRTAFVKGDFATDIAALNA